MSIGDLSLYVPVRLRRHTFLLLLPSVLLAVGYAGDQLETAASGLGEQDASEGSCPVSVLGHAIFTMVKWPVSIELASHEMHSRRRVRIALTPGEVSAELGDVAAQLGDYGFRVFASQGRGMIVFFPRGEQESLLGAPVSVESHRDLSIADLFSSAFPTGQARLLTEPAGLSIPLGDTGLTPLPQRADQIAMQSMRLPPMGTVQFREVLCNLLLRAGPEDFAYEAQWLGGHQAVILRQMIDFSSLPARVVEASGVNLRLPDAAESARHQIQEELMRLAVRP